MVKKLIVKRYIKDVVDNIVYDSVDETEYLMHDYPFPNTYTLDINGEKRLGCTVWASIDGKYMEWSNDEDSGVIEL